MDSLGKNRGRTARRSETEAHLRSMLEQAGVDLEQPDPLTTWRVFTKFGAKEIDGIQRDDDGFLFEWGVYGSSQLFHLGFLRQFRRRRLVVPHGARLR